MAIIYQSKISNIQERHWTTIEPDLHQSLQVVIWTLQI